MGCCGQRRSALRASSARSRAPLSVADAPVAGSGAPLRLRFLRGGSAQYRGAATGRTYAFTAGSPVQTVQPADAQILLRTGFFVVVG
jgi:hypothetical protein